MSKIKLLTHVWPITYVTFYTEISINIQHVLQMNKKILNLSRIWNEWSAGLSPRRGTAVIQFEISLSQSLPCS
jgi:hypothetical protein